MAVGVVSAFLGLIQVAQGPESPLRFFAFTNLTEAVGFFANRNHFAALNYALLLFAAAWAVHAATQVGTGLKQGQYNIASILGAVAGFTLLVVLLAAETMARSRAGLGLTIVGLIGALALGFLSQPAAIGSTSTAGSSRFTPGRRLFDVTPARLLVAAIALTITFSLQYALFRIRERFGVDPIEDARRIFIPNTIEAARAYMPFGSGSGTFVSVYPLFEKPEDILPETYANHAHNDFAEVWLETGLPGLLLMGLFLAWLVFRSVTVWRNPPPSGASNLDWSLVRAATIVIGLLIAHSIADYPLRTGAMMAIMAFACALLIESPPTKNEEGHAVLVAAPDRASHRKRRKPQPTLPRPNSQEGSADNSLGDPARRWGTDIEWPEEWSKSGDKDQASKPRKPPNK